MQVTLLNETYVTVVVLVQMVSVTAGHRLVTIWCHCLSVMRFLCHIVH